MYPLHKKIFPVSKLPCLFGKPTHRQKPFQIFQTRKAMAEGVGLGLSHPLILASGDRYSLWRTVGVLSWWAPLLQHIPPHRFPCYWNMVLTWTRCLPITVLLFKISASVQWSFDASRSYISQKKRKGAKKRRTATSSLFEVLWTHSKPVLMESEAPGSDWKAVGRRLEGSRRKSVRISQPDITLSRTFHLTLLGLQYVASPTNKTVYFHITHSDGQCKW